MEGHVLSGKEGIPSMRKRPRRRRVSGVLRALCAEGRLGVEHLVYPLFVTKGNKKEALGAMPGQYKYGLEALYVEVEACMRLGLRSFVLFPCLAEAKKDRVGSEAFRKEGLYLGALSGLKARFPDICLVSDVALDPYSSDGHDGLVEGGKVLNDQTLVLLGKMALMQAQAGVDMVGPSDMMDGRVGYIRSVLDAAGYVDVLIMSYTAKYASAFYGPFRDALGSAPKGGDKKTYQMDILNAAEAEEEASLDVEEGADILLVKPALAYLDVIRRLRERFPIPIAAYNVSGEYSMIKAAALQGWCDEEALMVEVLSSIHRAGARVVLSYFAKAYASFLKKQG